MSAKCLDPGDLAPSEPSENADLAFDPLRCSPLVGGPHSDERDRRDRLARVSSSGVDRDSSNGIAPVCSNRRGAPHAARTSRRPGSR